MNILVSWDHNGKVRIDTNAQSWSKEHFSMSSRKETPWVIKNMGERERESSSSIKSKGLFQARVHRYISSVLFHDIFEQNSANCFNIINMKLDLFRWAYTTKQLTLPIHHRLEKVQYTWRDSQVTIQVAVTSCMEINSTRKLGKGNSIPAFWLHE